MQTIQVTDKRHELITAEAKRQGITRRKLVSNFTSSLTTRKSLKKWLREYS